MVVEILRTRDGAQIAYQVLGAEHQRPMLVLVNGMSAVMEDWAHLAAALAETRPVLLLDHRGIGHSYLSDDGDEDITIESMAQDVLDLVKSLGVRTVQLLGFSMGGLVVQAILTHPGATKTSDGRALDVQGIEVRGAVLCSTFTKMPHGEFHPANVPNLEGMSRAERQRAQVAYMLEMQYHADVLGPHGTLQPTFERRLADAPNTRRPADIIGMQAGAIAQYTGRSFLSKVPRGLPIAVIHGRFDRMVDVAESDDLVKCLAQAQRLRPAGVPDADAFGHMWFDYFDLASAWVAPLVAFLDDTPSAHL